MKQLWTYSIGTIISPVKTFHDLLEDPDRIRLAWLLLAFLQVIYAPTLLLYHVAEIRPWYPVFLKIPPDYYFLYQVFFMVPLSILCLFCGNSTLVFLSRLFEGKGTYEDSFAVFVFSLTVPSLFLWAFDTILLLLFVVLDVERPTTGMLILNITYGLMWILWMFSLVSVSVSVSQKVSTWRAFMIGLMSFLVFLTMEIILLF